MKSAFLVVAVFALLNVTSAQKILPAFGKIDIADLELKECSFDPGAKAFKLLDWGSISYTRTGEDPSVFNAIYERRTRVKILRHAGLRYANLAIPYYSYNNEEKIVSVSACTYTLTEARQVKKTMVLKKSIYSRRINRQYSELIIFFPEAKVGTVIEYKYRVQSKISADVKDWFFQSDLPVRYSECQVKIPSGFSFTIHPLTADSLETKTSRYFDRFLVKGNMQQTEVVQKNFVLRDLPASRDEPFKGAARDYLQRLSFRLSAIDYGNGNNVYVNSEWEDVVEELLNDQDFGGQFNLVLPAAAAITGTAKNIKNTRERMDFVYHYVKDNISWNGVKNIYAYTGARKLLQQKTGSSGDINGLLLSLLRQAGINASPILFSTRDNGSVDTSLPLIKQFNTVMALVEDEQQQFVLDASDRFGFIDLIPAAVVNTRGFVVAADSGRWIHFIDTVHKYKVTTATSGVIDSAGWMKGDALISGSGYAHLRQGKDWIRNKEVTGVDLFPAEPPSFRAAEDNAGGKNTVPTEEQKLNFKIQLAQAGDHRYFKVNHFSELQDNPFTTDERMTDIDFGFLQEYRIYGNYIIPSEYEFVALPANFSLIMPDTSIVFKRFLSADNNSMNVVVSIDFKRWYFTASEYPDFAGFYKMMLAKLNEPVIIKKRDHP